MGSVGFLNFNFQHQLKIIVTPFFQNQLKLIIKNYQPTRGFMPATNNQVKCTSNKEREKTEISAIMGDCRVSTIELKLKTIFVS